MSLMEFTVILADPPWEYRSYSDTANGAAAAQYPTMQVADLMRLPVAEWSAPDAVLVMWGTWPKLDEAFPLLAAWGFDYVTGLPWVKTTPRGEIRRGIGFWFQSASELLLIGRRGEPRRADGKPLIGLTCGEQRQFYAPIRRHSEKPVGIYDWIEATFAGPYLELFARRERPGWTTWGADLGFRLTPGGIERVAPKEDPQLSLIST